MEYRNEEFEILRRMSVLPPTPTPVLNPALTLQLQDLASHVFVHNLVAEYIVRLVLATRNPAEFNMPDLTRVIQIFLMKSLVLQERDVFF